MILILALGRLEVEKDLAEADGPGRAPVTVVSHRNRATDSEHIEIFKTLAPGAFLRSTKYFATKKQL